MAAIEAELARYALAALAFGAVAYGLWHFLKKEPPGREPSLQPTGRR